MEERSDAELPRRRRTVGSLAAPVEDRRLPAPDVMGYLADRLIRRSDLSLVAEYVRDFWPNVTAIRCGVLGEEPYFAIHIAPFSSEAQQAHWPLAEGVRRLLATGDCLFFFLPPADVPACCAEFTLYEAEAGDAALGE